MPKEKNQLIILFITAIILSITITLVTSLAAASSAYLPVAIGTIILVILSIGIIYWIGEILMIYDAITRNFDTKLKWLLINTIVPFGWIFYYFIIKRRNITNKKKQKKKEPLAITSIILGYISWIHPSLGILLGTPAVILGIISLNKIAKNKKVEGKEVAITGIVLGAIGIIIAIAFISLYIAFFTFIIASDFPSTQFQEYEKNNITFENRISQEPLEADYISIGQYIYDKDTADEYCSTDWDIFTKNDVLCIEPSEVKGFETGQDGLHYFDIDYIIRDSNGELVEYQRENFGVDGNQYLPNGELNGYYNEYTTWVNVYLANIKEGNYTIEVLIYDKVSNKSLLHNDTFKILPTN